MKLLWKIWVRMWAAILLIMPVKLRVKFLEICIFLFGGDILYDDDELLS